MVIADWQVPANPLSPLGAPPMHMHTTRTCPAAPHLELGGQAAERHLAFAPVSAMLQGAKNLFRTSGAEAPAAAEAGPGEERAETEVPHRRRRSGGDRSAVEACSSAGSGRAATLPPDLIQRASSLLPCSSASSTSGTAMRRTSSLNSAPTLSDPRDPFASPGGKKKSTVMWQRAMRKSASEVEVPAPLPAEGAGVGLSSSEGWLDEAAAASKRYAAAAPIDRSGWGKVRESVASAPLSTFKIGELMLALRRQQAGAEFMRAKISESTASPTTRRARMARWGSREEAEDQRYELNLWMKSLKSNLPAITRKLVLHGASTQLQACVRRKLAPALMAKRRRLLHVAPAPAPAAKWNPYWQIDGDDVGPSVIALETRMLLARLDKGGRHAHLLPKKALGSPGSHDSGRSTPTKKLVALLQGKRASSFPKKKGGASPSLSFSRKGGSPKGGTSPKGSTSPKRAASPTTPPFVGEKKPPVGLAAAAATAKGSFLDKKDSEKIAAKPERPWTWMFQLTPSAITFLMVVLFEAFGVGSYAVVLIHYGLINGSDPMLYYAGCLICMASTLVVMGVDCLRTENTVELMCVHMMTFFFYPYP